MMACSTTNVDVWALTFFFCYNLSSTTMPTFSDYVTLVNLIGVFFQIRDDLMNLQSHEVCPR